jgi:hypothetical protein
VNTLANSAVSSASAVERIEELDWQRISQELDAQGCAILKGVLNREECRPVRTLSEGRALSKPCRDGAAWLWTWRV